jgi:cold shock protein
MPDLGRVKFFDAERGYGFITRNDGQDFFVHITASGNLPLQKGDKVEFEIELNECHGKPQAADVRVLTGGVNARA